MPWRAATVTTTISEVAGYSPKRKSLSLANNGTATVFFSQDPTAVTTQGFPLVAGASVTLIPQEGDEPEAAMYMAASVGSQDVRVEESLGP